jgi:glycosyltransferase involved in cell wall biosynthesis
MKIGINVSWMTPGAAGGMEWYVRCLLDQLARLDPHNDYLLVTAPNNDHTFARPGRRWDKVVYHGQENAPGVYRELPEVRPEPRWWYAAARQVYHRLKGTHVKRWHARFATLLARQKIDLWFCPFMYALPVDAGVPVVNTIPDLQHEHYPEFFHEHELTMRHLGYQHSCKAAAATIGISRHVADEIVRLYDVPAGKVFAVPLALDPFMERAGGNRDRLVADVRLKFRLDQDFVFYPANGWPHKNHETLVRAMARVARERPGLQLVLTGCPFDLLDRIKPILDEHGLHRTVRHLGYVTRADVAGLHAASTMLVFPSLFEGFGLPLLEAMHLGAPVACSNVGSLPEVGGDAVRSFDPRSHRDVADAILAVTGDAGLRRRLVEAGREQVGRFSYARTAADTLAVFGQVRDGTLPPPDVPPYRPLAQRRVLDQGHGRWFFRLRDVRRVKLQVMQAEQPGVTPRQSLEVHLDGTKLLDAPLDGRRTCEFVLPAAVPAREFHTLEVSASTKPFPGPGPWPVQVLSMVAVDSADQELRLVA